MASPKPTRVSETLDPKQLISAKALPQLHAGTRLIHDVDGLGEF